MSRTASNDLVDQVLATLRADQLWRDIRGMGDRLRHGYDGVSFDVLWNAVRFNVPGLANPTREALGRMQH